MPPPHHPITLRFIRRTANGSAQTDPRLDDSLVIQKLGENNVRVTYTERTEDGRIVDTALMTYQRLIHYVYQIFWLLSLDADPFQSVQFMIPGFPTTLINVIDVRAQMSHIIEILSSTLLHWPTISREETTPTAAIAIPTHTSHHLPR
jgi:hypothetical protein